MHACSDRRLVVVAITEKTAHGEQSQGRGNDADLDIGRLRHEKGLSGVIVRNPYGVDPTHRYDILRLTIPRGVGRASCGSLNAQDKLQGIISSLMRTQRFISFRFSSFGNEAGVRLRAR